MAKGVIPLDDEHEAIRAQLEKNRKAGTPLDGNEPKCIPNGPVMSMSSPGGLKVYATATELTMVVEDPGVLTGPWKFTRHFTRTAPSLVEMLCIPALDRNRDPTTGKPGLDLTPPKSTCYIPPGADK